jgi:hypothetical protein
MRPNIAEFTDQFGIILFVEKFHECEKFYAEMIGLRILYRAKLLTRFEFGNGYLMGKAKMVTLVKRCGIPGRTGEGVR